MKCRTKTAKQKKAPPKGEKIMAKRVFIIVLDSFGIGEMPDAARFGDVGSNTLGAIVKSPKYHTPTLQSPETLARTVPLGFCLDLLELDLPLILPIACEQYDAEKSKSGK